jgi:hypothetical protein
MPSNYLKRISYSVVTQLHTWRRLKQKWTMLYNYASVSERNFVVSTVLCWEFIQNMVIIPFKNSEYAPQGPDLLWSPPTLLSNWHRGYFIWKKASGAWSSSDLHLLPRSRMKRLYFHSREFTLRGQDKLQAFKNVILMREKKTGYTIRYP